DGVLNTYIIAPRVPFLALLEGGYRTALFMKSHVCPDEKDIHSHWLQESLRRLRAEAGAVTGAEVGPIAVP
ncbi:hypothetical protein, partial [Brevibacterium sp. ZH18]|uniref:hypothetical protein n=1 Tax=Brevibacterium sp. ZH18 TaxID=2927784 RepID=UPI001F614310